VCALQNEHNNEYAVPFDADLECKTHVVVYDGSTNSLAENWGRWKIFCMVVFKRRVFGKLSIVLPFAI